MFKAELVEVGDNLGVVLPDELIAHLNLTVGDTLDMTETADGIRLSTVATDINVSTLGINQNRK